MAFNINEFKSVMNKYGGPVRKNLYLVEISPLRVANDGMSVRDLRFFCQSAAIPGLNYTVTDYFPNGFGVKQSIPAAYQQDSFNAVFMLDSDHMVLRFFHQWMQTVINYNYADGPLSQVGNQLPFEIGYKSDYAAKITIKHFSTNSNGEFEGYYQYDLFDAFPTQISGVDVAWSDNDSFATATVNFSYSHIAFSGSIKGSPTERFSRGTGLLELINSIGLTGQYISQGTLPLTIQDSLNAFTRANLAISGIRTGFNQIKTGLTNIGNVFR
jgi:hypothetical protein